MEAHEQVSGPRRPRVERAAAWVAWFGPGRLVLSALSMIVVVVGAVWLVRSPSPPIEASLPAAAPGATVDSTLPPPPTAAPTVAPVPPTRPVVHVAGAVRAPGVYELAPGSRVRDAIEAAGGPAPDAAEQELNLAAPLADGSRMYVPAVGEEVAGPLVVAPAGAGGEGPDQVGGLVDVNRATVDELVTLPGVGPATATAIVEDRARNGPFAGVDDLDRVTGIGPAKLDALRDLVTT